MPPRISDRGAQITEKLRKRGDGGVWEPLFQRRGRDQQHPHVGASSRGVTALVGPYSSGKGRSPEGAGADVK